MDIKPQFISYDQIKHTREKPGEAKGETRSKGGLVQQLVLRPERLQDMCASDRCDKGVVYWDKLQSWIKKQDSFQVAKAFKKTGDFTSFTVKDKKVFVPRRCLEPKSLQEKSKRSQKMPKKIVSKQFVFAKQIEFWYPLLKLGYGEPFIAGKDCGVAVPSMNGGKPFIADLDAQSQGFFTTNSNYTDDEINNEKVFNKHLKELNAWITKKEYRFSAG